MREFRFYAGLLCVTCATLMLQLVQTRILSVVAWYHLAFFVISTAMFGLTAGAVWVYLRRERFSTQTLSFDLAHYSALFGLSTALALAIQMTIAVLPFPGLTTIIIWLELAICQAVPFFFSGVVVSLALTRSPFPIGRVYGVDLIGAALGCFGVLVLLNLFDGPTAVLWIGVVPMLGALLFAGSAIGAEPAQVSRLAEITQRRKTWLMVLGLLAFVNGENHARTGFYPVIVKGKVQLGVFPWHESWNTFSRVVAQRPGNAPAHMWGPSPRMVPADWIVPQSYLNIDGDAGTAAYGISGDLSRAGFLKYDITNLAYHLPNLRRSAVIGVGGGRDLISAKLFGVEQVTGVEINPAFVELLQDDPRFSVFVGLNRMDGVSLVVDEARSWFARSREQFDLIQMSLIDTWAATSAGAFTLSENGLYTIEAWEIFFRRLNPSGVFTVSRWYSPGDVNETGRMVSLAVAALIKSGVSDPSRHIYLAAGREIATLVVSRSGFTSEQIDALTANTEQLEFTTLITPARQPGAPILNQIVHTASIKELFRFTSRLDLDLTPPTDDRPFFFNQLPILDAVRDLARAGTKRPHGVSQGNYFATSTLVSLFLVSLILVVTAILVPLRPALNDVGRRLAAGGTAYFVLIGMGFMFVEIAFLQRFSVFLGHPIYSLSVVLFSLILSTGIGSLISDAVPIERKPNFMAWSILTGALILSQPYWVPGLLLQFDNAPLQVRSLVTVSMILPAGILMGFGFPAGMRFISAVDQRPTPWFWGINGASGVLASAMAVACSLALGIGATMSLGAVCYLLLIPAAMAIGFPRRDASPTMGELKPEAA
jgi:spermidine synthase